MSLAALKQVSSQVNETDKREITLTSSNIFRCSGKSCPFYSSHHSDPPCSSYHGTTVFHNTRLKNTVLLTTEMIYVVISHHLAGVHSGTVSCSVGTPYHSDHHTLAQPPRHSCNHQLTGIPYRIS